MTCIVGLVDKEKVYIGGDSAATAGYLVLKRIDTKVFNKGEFVIGATTSFRMIQILNYSFDPPEITKDDLHEYMCTDFIKAVKKAFKKNGYKKSYSDGEDKGGSFLVGVRGRLFEIDTDFQVGENLDGYASIGCGYHFAYGSLYSTESFEYSAVKRVSTALEAAAKFDTAVKEPFIIKSTNETEIT
jgi:ATP-dependent protease HslVU (ClpYQ) peptidase subunit